MDMKQNNKNKKVRIGKDKLLSDIKSKPADEVTELAESIIDTVREPLLILDKDLRVVKASQSFFDFFRVSPEETIGTLIYDLGNRQWDIPKLRELLETILPEKTTFDNYEVEHIFSTIGKRIMLLNARQIERVFGKEKIILLAIEDITERKHLEDSLSETSRMTSEYLDILVNHAHFPIIIWDASFVITRFNNSFEKLSGYDISEVMGKKIDFLFPENKRESTLKLLEDFLGDEKFEIIEIDILRKDKEIRTVLWNSAHVFDKDGRIIIATIAQDINERKRVEMKLQESEERFRKLFENAKIGLYRTTPSGNILMANNELVKMLGYPSFDALASRNVEIGGFGPSYPRKEFIEMIEKNGEVINFESEWIRLDGTAFFVSENAQAIRGSKNNILYFDGVVEDITERRQAAETLSNERSLLRTIIDLIPSAIYAVDIEGRKMLANAKEIELSGKNNEDEIIGKTDFDLYSESEAQRYYEEDQIIIQSGKPALDMEDTLISKDGQIHWMLGSKVPLRDVHGQITGIVGVNHDITDRKLAEKENIMLAHSLKSINECVSITDINDKIIFVNKAFLDTYGYDETELIGKQINILRSKTNKQELVDEILPATKQGQWKGELLNQRKDGSEFPVSLSTSIIYDKDSKPLGLIGVASDITAQKQIVDDLLKLSSAVEQSPASIIITDIEGNIEYVNPKATEITGYQISELKGRNPRIFATGEKPAHDYKVLWDTISSGEEWHGEFHNKKKNGELYWESASISAIKNNMGEIIHYLAVKEDITEQKKINEVLINSKEKAEEMNRLKSNFLANMSHELRTPLVGILGYAEIIRQEKVSHEIKVMAENICKSGNRLSETLNLILDLSQLEAEKRDIRFQKIELVNKTKEIIDLFTETAYKKSLLLKSSFSSDSIFINFDERAYHSILNNLINNAIKFTSEGSVTTSVSLYDHSVEINVTDTGIGIAQKDYQSIFDEFRQASEGYSRNFEGSGLGLSITKKFVEKYGGIITVESEVGKGSTFKVVLPVTNGLENLKERAESKIIISAKSPETKLENPIGLLVDDDPVVFQVMKRYLRDYLVLEKTDSAEIAFKMLKEKKYNIIFMDINLMHGMDGKKAAAIIRKMDGYQSTPIIATTAFVMPGDREEFISAGCSHYLSKPFSKADIIDVVAEALISKYDS
ncbi:MAG: PAS domain S-box protein [Ignavibacterium sp.]|nr:PAS domain S-box protein [Ignavibacterium sp.]